MKYKIGDKVWLRDDLEIGERYGCWTFVEGMKSDCEATVLESSNPDYRLDISSGSYTDEMIDHDKTARLHRERQDDPQPEIVESPGGGKKDDGGKLRMDLLDPEFLEEMAKVLSYGSRKYGDYNFLGLEPHRVEASLFRHFNDYRKGEHIDHDEPHCNNMAGVAANAMMWFMIERENKNEAVL